MTLNAIRETWITERPTYTILCEQVEDILRKVTQQRGIRCRVNSRAKTIDSLLKKVLKKQYGDPYLEIQDKAGVRVICTYQDSLPSLEEVIRDSFEECGYENKATSLNYDTLGYSGIHFEVKLRPEQLESFPGLSEKACEVQVLTEAQALWANVSHDLVYKAAQDPPQEVKRRIYHQAAILQSFDDAIVQAKTEALRLPGFQEAAMLEELERHFYRFTAEPFDRELSLYILEALKPLFLESELAGFEALVERFVELRGSDLDRVFRQYSEVIHRSPLLFQPEIFAIFMCLERDMFSLKDAWGKILPLDELQTLADLWAVDIGIVE